VNAELIGLLTAYGLPMLFLILVATSVGVPFPDSLLLVAVGSFVAQGDLEFWPVVAVGTAGAVVGDNLGYALGYWGGRPIATRLGGGRIAKAEAFSRKWGGPGIFLSRWLVGPLGPWINVTSGLTAFGWPRFLVLDVLGEFVWLLLYVSLGRRFSDKVQAVADILGNLTWVVVGVAVTGFLGWRLWRAARPAADVSVPRSVAEG
jgi:membrane protein DedA with SNARE-associated domain